MRVLRLSNIFTCVKHVNPEMRKTYAAITILQNTCEFPSMPQIFKSVKPQLVVSLK